MVINIKQHEINFNKAKDVKYVQEETHQKNKDFHMNMLKNM
jgi:hypothetical protein